MASPAARPRGYGPAETKGPRLTTRTLPMFPLGNVLVPEMLLPLQLFEERYLTLLQDVMAGDKRFGVVLIDRGHEVGGGEVRTDVGTVAEIIAANQSDDGRWFCLAGGVQRLRVLEWLPDDPYPMARVELLDDPTEGGSHELRDRTVAALRTMLARGAELGDNVAPATAEVSLDPTQASWDIAVLASLGPLDTQRVLVTDDTDERLELLLTGITEIAQDMSLRLAMGEDDR